MRKTIEDLLAKFGYRTWGKALRDAAEALIEARCGTICVALDLTRSTHLFWKPWWMPRQKYLRWSANERKYRLRIELLIHPCPTYKQWVFYHHPDVFYVMREKAGAFTQGRVQWLQHMIEEYYAK